MRRALVTSVGLDLSSAKCGLSSQGGADSASWLIQSPDGLVAEARAVWWRDCLLERCEGASIVVFEEFAFSQPQRAHEIGGVAYVVRIALAEAGLNVVTISVAANKKFCTGRGNANKHEMVLGVYKRWGFETKYDDVADAYSLARCGLACLNPKNETDRAVLKKARFIKL